MEEEGHAAVDWSGVALTVPGTLMLVATSGAGAALSYVAAAQRTLHDAAGLLHEAPGDAAKLLDGVFALPPAGAGPLPEAQRELRRLANVHVETGHLLSDCAPHLGLEPGVAPWRTWRYHRNVAAAQAKEALLRLGSAEVDAVAAAGVVRLCLAKSPRREEYMSAAEQTVRDAIAEVDRALAAVRRMRHAVALQFFESWMILKR